MLVYVCAYYDVNARTGPGPDAIDRRRGDDVSVDHWLPRQEGSHHLTAPELRVGMRKKIGFQLRLGLKQAIERDRRDRLSGCRDAKLLGEVLADPLRGLEADHVMSCTTLAMARRNKPSAEGMERSAPTLIAPADSPKMVTWPGSPPKAKISPAPK